MSKRPINPSNNSVTGKISHFHMSRNMILSTPPNVLVTVGILRWERKRFFRDQDAYLSTTQSEGALDRVAAEASLFQMF